MTLFQRLLLITIIESASTVFIERGIFFYTKEKLTFTDGQNLALALAFAVPYAFCAFFSHAVTTRISEKRLTFLAILGQSLFLAAVAVRPTTVMIFVAKGAMGAFTGLKWPPVESYVSAGLTPSQTQRRLGIFNVSWAGIVPITVMLVGPLIAGWDRGLFVAPIVIACFSIYLLRPLPQRPAHLPHDHPDRPTETSLRRLRLLLVSSRWSLLGSYATYFTLAALMPGIFDRLGFSVAAATPLSAITEIARVGMFALLAFWPKWHDRAWPLAIAPLALVAGFLLVLGEQSTPTVLAGEVIFGLAMGMAYYAALYYAMIVKNAAVDAGGVHEALIGVGFIIGPIAGLIGSEFAAMEGVTRFWGMLAGLGPMLLICTIAGMAPLARLRPAEGADD